MDSVSPYRKKLKLTLLCYIYGSHRSDYEDFCPFGYIAVQSCENLTTRSFWLGSLFKPEDGGDMILRNVG